MPAPKQARSKPRAVSERRRKQCLEAQRRYKQTAKGRETIRCWEKSPKSRARKRAYNVSSLGHERQRRYCRSPKYRQRRREYKARLANVRT